MDKKETKYFFSIIDRKTKKKTAKFQKRYGINKLLKDIERCAPGSPTIGKAEKLKYSNQGLLSIRIDKKNRLIYRIEQEGLYIISCCGHYD